MALFIVGVAAVGQPRLRDGLNFDCLLQPFFLHFLYLPAFFSLYHVGGDSVLSKS